MKTRAELTTEIATQLASGQPIIAAQLRLVMDDFNSSEHNTLTDGTPVIVNGALGTPSSGTATNLTGTAAGLTAGAVTTNANLTGDVTSVGNATTLTNAPVIAKVLTGYVSGAGTVAATDSILQAIQKLNGNDATNANLTGDVTSVGNATTLTNAPVIAKVLTGYVSGAGTVAATDSILQAIQKLNGNDATNANLTGDVTSVGNATTLAAGSASVLNSGTLPSARMPALTGDITTSAGAVVTALATVNANVGSFGSATASVALTVNAKGLITAASAATITPAVGSITGLGTGVATALALAPNVSGGFSTLTQGTLSGTTPAITFTDSEQELDWTMTGNSTPTASGYAARRKVQIFITGDTSTRTFTWPAWTWMGGSPASSTANKKMRIALECRGATAASVFATYAEQA